MRYLVILIFLFSCQKWKKIETYTIPVKSKFSHSFRTMAQHDSLMQNKSWPYIVKHQSDSKNYIYFGSYHTNDPNDKQISKITKLIEGFKPTILLTENQPGFYLGGLSSAIENHAEFGLLKYYALNNDIKIYSLEPSWEDEVEEMKSEFPKQDLTIFYTLRVFLNERSDEKGEELDDLADHLLGKRGSRKGLSGSFEDLNAMDSYWKKHYHNELGDWRQLAKNKIHPATHPNKLQKIANLANEIRDRHAARLIIYFVNKSERVFALAGGSHVVKQELVIENGIKNN